MFNEIRISAVVLTKNEEGNIGECLNSLAWCDEVVVIDDNSTDRTRAIAKKLGAKVYQRELNGDFAAQRNFGMEKASEKWVIFVDADERIAPELAEEIKQKIKAGEAMGFRVKRDDFIWGRRLSHGETANLSFVRLGRRGAGKWKRRVHEYWDIKGRLGELKNPLLHFPHPTIREFLDSVNFMSTLHAKANLEEGKKSSLAKIIFWPRFKFLNNWIIKQGFLDGTPGLLVAAVMSFHSFLAWSKLWLLQKGTTDNV